MAQPETEYYSINGVNGEKNSLTGYKHRRQHFKTSKRVILLIFFWKLKNFFDIGKFVLLMI